MSDDDPITLSRACEIFQGAIRPATLRAEAARGNLEIFRIGRRHFTTAASVREMIRKCRVAAQPPGSISTRSASPGQSETERILSAQAALNQTLRELKERLKRTSAPSTNRSAARRH